MSVPPQTPYDAAPESRTAPNLMRSALWVAIGALILAAIVCVVWVLIGPDNGIIGRAFLTILLLAGFAGVAILDAQLAPRRPSWLVLASMVVWIVILLDGAFLIWMPFDDYYFGGGFGRFVAFILIVGVLQLGLLHVRLYLNSYRRYVTGFTSAIAWTTIALLAVLALMLVLALTLYEFIDFGELYWRIVVAITILAAVGTALLPLINALFAPKKPAPAPVAYAYGYGYAGAPYPGSQPQGYPGADPAYGAQQAAPPQAAPPQTAPQQPAPEQFAPQQFAPQQPAAAAPELPPWPTFADGVTPLPVLPDGSPDWNAYYTGYPTYPAAPAQQQPPAAPPAQGYQGYPPPPPAPR